MKYLVSVLVALPFLLAGCATTPPREVLARPARTVIVAAFPPEVHGINVGTTVFQNRHWEARPDSFEANGVAAANVPQVLLQPIAVVDGTGSGLEPPQNSRRNSDAFTRGLGELAAAQKADRLVVLTSGDTGDVIYNTNQVLKGLGLYRREVFGMRRVQVYGAFRLVVFDAGSNAFVASDQLFGSREVYSVEWHSQWSDFSPAEQHRIVGAWTELVTEKTAQLLTRAGLANAPLPEKKSAAVALLLNPNRPKSWLPEGNVLPIPPGIPPERASAAVVRGLQARKWTLVSESDALVVGFYRDGAKEAGVSAKLSATEITLVADDHEIKSDGSRVSVPPFKRWHENLKESIYRDLLNAEAALPAVTPLSP